jgi:hypothetical protein
MRNPNVPRMAIISGRSGTGNVCYPREFARLASLPSPPRCDDAGEPTTLDVPMRGGSAALAVLKDAAMVGVLCLCIFGATFTFLTTGAVQAAGAIGTLALCIGMGPFARWIR